MGVEYTLTHLPATATEADLEAAVQAACQDASVDGVLIQLPLPPHLDEERIMELIDPRKDVDGFHPLNMGRLLARGIPSRFVPATALGCIELLERSNISVQVRALAFQVPLPRQLLGAACVLRCARETAHATPSCLRARAASLAVALAHLARPRLCKD